MSDFFDAFREDLNVTAIITRDETTGINPDGSPIVNTIEIYNGLAIKWLLTSNQQFASDKVNNPATHRLVLDPDSVTQPIAASDIITIDGVVFNLEPGENILDQDVYVYDISIRDTA